MRTGSFINLIQGESAQQEPKVGDGATRLLWTDRVPATIIEVRGNVITVQDDNYKRIDSRGMTDSGQEYEYSTNPNGRISHYSKRKNGAWVEVGSSLKNGQRLGIGYRERYYDFSF